MEDRAVTRSDASSFSFGVKVIQRNTLSDLNLFNLSTQTFPYIWLVCEGSSSVEALWQTRMSHCLHAQLPGEERPS